MEEKKPDIRKIVFIIFGVIFIGSIVALIIYSVGAYNDKKALEAQQEELNRLREEAREQELARLEEEARLQSEYTVSQDEIDNYVPNPEILAKYKDLYDSNNYLIGWLCIDDTVIDYPVVQTPEDENMYLYKDFYGNENKNGTLIMDTDSVVGLGEAEYNYYMGYRPSTNMIIHGHTMKNGDMFGNLKKYHDKEYCEEHKIIKFDSLYEEREYEVIAAFDSKVYYSYETDVFKYYNFFQANSTEEFDYWYNNIKDLSLYDTGVTAEYGDEFITLSCCAYHTQNGRFVVVGKRVK